MGDNKSKLCLNVSEGQRPFGFSTAFSLNLWEASLLHKFSLV